MTYSYTRRNFNKQDISYKTTKKKIVERDGSFCCFCRDIVNQQLLEIEHHIPISCGGKETDLNNLYLICKKHHKEKTRKDILVLNALKKLKVIKGSNNSWDSTVPLSELRDLYKKFLQLLEYSESKWDSWS